MLTEDIRLSREMYRLAQEHPSLEALSQSLSIATFRYFPPDLEPGSAAADGYLDDLNKELLTRLQGSGEAYVSNAIVDGKYALRACIVNFRTSLADVEALIPLVVRIGGEVDSELRSKALITG
jgi:glutamate/tyrosine decarboxylase-like PLP-dependent enzyme